MPRLHFFIANGSPIPITARYRCLHLREQLEILGHAVTIAEDWFDDARISPGAALGCDFIILYRLMMSPAIERLIAAAHRAGKPIIFDTDDLIFERDLISAHRAVQALPADDQKRHAEGVGCYSMTLQASDAVMVSTPLLAELARQRGKRAFVHRNCLGGDMLVEADRLYEARKERPPEQPVVVGYGSGTHTHDVDFLEVDGALVELLGRFPDVELWIAGPLAISERLSSFRERVRRFPLADWREWFGLASEMDIAIAPLEPDNIFCRAKSEIKFVEAGALGVPIVASDIDPYRDVITAGRDGLLARDRDGWIDALSSLITDRERRAEMGDRARETVMQRYTPEARAADLAVILPQLESAAQFCPSGRVPEARVPLLINWLVPEPFPGAGGDTGLFRIIRHLAEFGHKCNVYVVHYNLMNYWTSEQIRFYVRKHFGPTRAEYHRWSGRIGDADCTFATFWPTVESLLPQPNGGKRYYLVQDHEPVFYPDHEEHRQRAERTYLAGLHCITLGPWVAKVLHQRYGVCADHFEFAVDPRIYWPRPELRRPEQRVCFYARPSTTRRAYDIGIAALALVKARLPEVEIALFGSSGELSPAPAFEHVNCGMLSHEELSTLFASSDVGLVFSLTNPSFVPLEMMACGCAVVEAASERWEGILNHGEDSWLVENLDPQEVANAICRLLENNELRTKIVENGCRRTQSISWRKSVRHIEEILLRDIPVNQRLLRRRERPAQAAAGRRPFAPDQSVSSRADSVVATPEDAAVSSAAVDQLPSRHFNPRVIGVGAWTDHLPFGYDVVAALQPQLLVELGTDRGESYFCFCQSVAENRTSTRCFAVDSWRGDEHAGSYDDPTFEQVAAHNQEHYAAISTLIRSDFDDAVGRFDDETIDLLHLDGLHTAEAVRHDLDLWLPKLRPGGILLLHDVSVRARGFGVWEVWGELRERGRSYTFEIGPGLGVWQKPGGTRPFGFLEPIFERAHASHDALANYYIERAAELQRIVAEKWRDGSILRTAFARETIVQIFYSNDGGYTEERSVSARIAHGAWKSLRFTIPAGFAGAPLRLDFVSAFNTLEVAEITISAASGETLLALRSPADFERLRIAGDAERISHPEQLWIKVTGVDPQVYFPQLNAPQDEELSFAISLRVSPPEHPPQ